MNTRTTIKQTALALFNTHGLDNISLRDIAKEAGISPGNLTYHFKRRDDLVYALYLDLVEEIDAHLEGDDPINIEAMLVMSDGVYHAFERHRFIMVDFVSVMHNHPKIHEHYAQLRQRRQRQSMLMFAQLVEDGVMHPAAFPGQWETLLMNMTLVGDFFLMAAQWVYAIDPAEQKRTYTQLLSQLIWPYLTPKGQMLISTLSNR